MYYGHTFFYVNLLLHNTGIGSFQPISDETVNFDRVTSEIRQKSIYTPIFMKSSQQASYAHWLCFTLFTWQETDHVHC